MRDKNRSTPNRHNNEIDGGSHIEFLYKAIDDAQSIIRLLDTKAAVSFVPIGFMIVKILNNSSGHKLCFGVRCWREFLFYLLSLSILMTALVAFKIVFPLINPIEHIDMPSGVKPPFFIAGLHPKKWQALWSGKKKYSMLSVRHEDYCRSLDHADENRIKSVLAGELLKTSYIRNIKMFRLQALGWLLLVSALLFVISDILVPLRL